MGISVARLRAGLVVGVALLGVVVAGFLGYARYRTHRFLAGLPAKLGMDIRRETNGYTYSQSVGGKTVMTLHAAKAVEHNNGKITLHDVSMVLYGRKQDRADQISGAEFEYEQASGVVRAVGEVHIDLQAPTTATEHGKPPAVGVAAVDHTDSEAGGRMIHVKTSGLVYLQKLGVAATDQELEFRFGEMTGHAKGAEYNSDTGIVILQSAVKANGLQHGTPVVLTATHGELNRQSELALLTDARYVSPGQTVRGDHAVVHLRADGSPERIEAEGNVALESPSAGRVAAPHGDVLLNAAGQAQEMHLFGGVRYAETSSLREGRGEAEDARVAFDATGHPEHVVLVGAVHVEERVRGTEAAAWSERDAGAVRMTFALVDDGSGKRRVLREANAVGAARMTLVSDAGLASQTKSEIAGELLRGDFVMTGKGVQLSKVHGSGHTSLRRTGLGGAEQRSSGDTLEVVLRAGNGHLGKRKAETSEIAQAVQAGHVVLTSRAEGKAGTAPVMMRAMADLAVYDGNADHLTLTGHAQVADEQGTVSAARIVMEHESGDAIAEGSVKATYLQSGTASQPNAAGPVHVVADHAELQHEAQRAIFYGAVSGAAGAGRPARLWQGTSQVEAPVLDLEQKEGRLTAHGEAGDAPPVHAVLVGKSSGEAKKQRAQGAAEVVRVSSRSMVYLDEARRVDFNGDVKVEDRDGTLRASQATAYLQPVTDGAVASKTSMAASKESGVFFGGSVERIVAEGKIGIEQPGRRATGDRLMYTAADGLFVLTGTATAPPRLIDEAQGTVTGSSLRFHSGDQSIVVVGDAGSDPNRTGQRVHTVTRVKQR